MASSSPAIQPQDSKVLTTTRSGGERSSDRPGKASAKATTEAISQAGVSSPSTNQTSSHSDSTVTSGSRMASSASSNRLCAKGVAEAADGKGKGTPARN